jgi:hypothetical protein
MAHTNARCAFKQIDTGERLRDKARQWSGASLQREEIQSRI